MRSKGNGRSRARPSAPTTQSLVEVVAMLAASTVMALMVVAGGIAVEQLTTPEPSTVERIVADPEPLSWREST